MVKTYILFYDGIRVENRWKCDLIDNFIFEDDGSDVDIPVQYPYHDYYFLVYGDDGELIYEDGSPLPNVNIFEFENILKESYDFWNYMMCDEKLYHFFIITYYSYLTTPDNYLQLEIEIKTPFFESLKDRDYYIYLVTILRYIRRCDDRGCVWYVYSNLDILTNFFRYFYREKLMTNILHKFLNCSTHITIVIEILEVLLDSPPEENHFFFNKLGDPLPTSSRKSYKDRFYKYLIQKDNICEADNKLRDLFISRGCKIHVSKKLFSGIPQLNGDIVIFED